MILHKGQSKIAKDLHRFRILVCGRKFGKTTLAAEEIIGKAISKKGRRVLYIAPTRIDARRLMWDRLRNRLKDVLVKENDTRLELKIRTVNGGTSEIYLGSWEIIDSYRGDEFDFVVCDEVQDYPNFWVGWLEALRPTLTPRQGSALFMGTPKGFNHFFDLFNVLDDNFCGFKFTTYDNPHIPLQEIEEAKRQLPEDKFAQEYLAEFKKMEGLVYREFTREHHTYNELPVKIISWLVGIDFGYTNPCAILKIGIDYDNNYWVEDEYYKTQQSDDQIAELASSFKPNYVYPDPEAPEKIARLKSYSLNVREVNKGGDSIKTGINKVRELFKQGRLKVNKRCVNLLWELETYRYPEKRLNHNEQENPVKENDHAVDALRYAIMTHLPSNPIMDMWEARDIERQRSDKRSFK